jgi:uncharacterized metal-binding protein
MPSGRTHDRITLWLFPPIVGWTLLFSRNSTIALLLSSGFLFSGLMFGPDLDIYSVQYRRWGFLRWIWRPYQSMIPHRSWLSHGWLIGTFVRTLYLALMLAFLGIPILILIQLLWGIHWDGQELSRQIWQLVTHDHPQETIALIVGLELGSMSHSLSDWIGSAIKRSKGRSKRQKRKKP